MSDNIRNRVLDALDAAHSDPLAMKLVKVAAAFDDSDVAALLRRAADALMRDTYTPPAGFRLVADAAPAPTANGTGPAHYLSGPMTGLPKSNYPAFHSAAAALRARGINVVSPAEIADTTDDWTSCMRADLAALCGCDALVLLPGWERSQGAHLELHIAHRLGLHIVQLRDMLPDPQPYSQSERAYVAQVASDAGITLGGAA